MPRTHLSASELKKCIEVKAYAYGVSAPVSTLIGEYVIKLLREATHSTHTQSYEPTSKSGLVR